MKPQPLTHDATIRVEALRLLAFHGVDPQERTVGNTFEVSVAIHCALPMAAFEADDLQSTVNYAEVITLIRNEMKTPARLLESVAWRIARRIIDTFSCVNSVDVQLCKLCPPCGVELRQVGVDITLYAQH